MLKRFAVPTILLLGAALPAVSAEPPDAKAIVKRVIAAAGGDVFATLGTLELDVVEEEIRNDGTLSEERYKLFVDTSNLNNLRMELPGDIVVGATRSGGWSTTAGTPDDRPQTPVMARKSLNQKAFPLLLPYSLELEGVWLKEVQERVTDDGRKVWVIGIPFTKGFFMSPVLETTWIMVVDQDDYSILSLEFAPALALRDVSPVGVRYRILRQADLKGAKVVDQLLAVGINSQYQESGATRVTKITPTVHESRNVSLFMSPKQLEAFEED